jgi:signal transduction histidine kinase
MGELFDDLLDLSRVSRQELTRTPIDLGDLAREVVQALHRSTPERVAQVVIGAELVAEADPRLMRVALENLLGNAWKFTARRETAEITLDCAVQAGERVFFVRDNGAGFDARHAHKLFAPFQRLHTQSEFAGTGIGLATVQRIVDRHGGRVWAESELGAGTTFYFTLPSATLAPR